MAYKIKTLKVDRRGNYCRDLGWKLDTSGKRKQHRFYFGKDEDAAERCNARLEAMWQVIVSEAEAAEAAIWSESTLDIAKQIAAGVTTCRLVLPHCSAGLDDDDLRAYVKLVDKYAKKFPMVAILAADMDAYLRGCKVNDSIKRKVIELGREVFDEPNLIDAETKTLHEALRDYAEWTKRTYVDPETKTTTPWGMTQVNEVNRLIEKHKDISLSRLDLTTIENMVNLWRGRPLVKDREMPISPKTAENHIKRLKNFFWWLHRQNNYRWQIPPEVERLPTKVKETEKEIQRKIHPEQVGTYTIEELTTLYRYATPLERVYLLLGLNCGFSIAEFGSLRINQIFLRKRHGHDDLINYQSTPDQSWIKRLRIKTQVYGEFILWPQTVQAIEHAIRRRREQPDFAPDAILNLTERGLPYSGQTAGGNHSTRITKLWHRGLLDRVQKDHLNFRRLSPKSLRKTSGNMIREITSGEIMAVFHCRGKAVKTDDLADVYSNRPFGKVFRAIEELGKRLQPMFDAVADPFPLAVKKGGANISLGKIDTIRQLHGEGKTAVEIAKAVGVSPQTVYRHI